MAEETLSPEETDEHKGPEPDVQPDAGDQTAEMPPSASVVTDTPPEAETETPAQVETPAPAEDAAPVADPPLPDAATVDAAPAEETPAPEVPAEPVAEAPTEPAPEAAPVEDTSLQTFPATDTPPTIIEGGPVEVVTGADAEAALAVEPQPIPPATGGEALPTSDADPLSVAKAYSALVEEENVQLTDAIRSLQSRLEQSEAQVEQLKQEKIHLLASGGGVQALQAELRQLLGLS